MPTEDTDKSLSLSAKNEILNSNLSSIRLFLKSCDSELLIINKKISFFEYGFDLSSKGKLSIFDFTAFKSAEYIENGFRFKIKDKKKPNHVLSINNRGELKVKFGYNGSGDFLIASSVDGSEIDINKRNLVTIYAIDLTGFNSRKYWFFTEGDKLYGSLNDQRKTVFELFFTDV